MTTCSVVLAERRPREHSGSVDVRRWRADSIQALAICHTSQRCHQAGIRHGSSLTSPRRSRVDHLAGEPLLREPNHGRALRLSLRVMPVDAEL